MALIFGYDVLTYNGEQPNCMHPKFLNTIYNASDFYFSNSLEFYTKRWNTHWVLYNSNMYNDYAEKKSIFQIINDRKKGIEYIWFYPVEPFASLENFFGNGHFYNEFILNNIPKPTLNEIVEGNGRLLINYVIDGGLGITYTNFKKIIDFTRNNNIPDEKVYLVFSDFKLKENLEKLDVKYNVADYNYNMIGKSQEIYNTINREDYSYWGDDAYEPQFGKIRKRQNSAVSSEEFLNSIGNDRKDFLLLIRRWKLHRIILLSHLNKMGLDKNLVSWDNKLSYELEIDEFLKHDNDPEFIKMIMESSSILDVDDLDKISGMGFENKDIYLNTYISIVTESIYFQEDKDFPAGYLSEKVWKPVGHCQPFILASASGSLKYMRNRFGYKTFHPYIDESYDLEEDDIKRLDMIKLEIEKFSNKTKEEKDQFLNDVKDICVYNQNLFFEYAVNGWKNGINNKEMVRMVNFLFNDRKDLYLKHL